MVTRLKTTPYCLALLLLLCQSLSTFSQQTGAKAPVQPCPSPKISLIKKAAASEKFMGDFQQTCARDSGCYAKCFCTSVKKAVAVLRKADIDRKGPTWSSCMKQTWQHMVQPKAPKKAMEAWKKPSCKSSQQCT